MYTITYNLLNAEGRSNEFYESLKRFSDHAFRTLDEQYYDELLAYFRYRRHVDLETIYSFEEGYLEMLTLGVFWQIYSGDAQATDDQATEWISKLTHYRENHKAFKPLVDSVRGLMMTAMMQPDLYDHMSLSKPSFENLNDLLNWLEATGEFKHEVERLRHWESYARTLTQEKLTNLLSLCISGALWFEKESEVQLGAFTPEVDRYLNEMRPKHYWKEDVIFCGRRRVEYHLNMMASEWLNKAYREAFEACPDRVLLLPMCMRLKDNESCQMTNQGAWYTCQQCDALCQVKQVTDIAEEYGCKTYLLPHSASLKEMPTTLDLSQTGVIGAACVLHLISGGWMLANKGIAAQCIVLDYCGCKAHWHPEGMPTSLSKERLKQILIRSVQSDASRFENGVETLTSEIV